MSFTERTTGIESWEERNARIDRVIQANHKKLPTEITVVTLAGTVVHGIVEERVGWVVSGERIGFEWRTPNTTSLSSYGENAYFDNEDVGWIRGHALIGGEAVAALLVAHALRDRPPARFAMSTPASFATRSKRYTP